MIENVKRIMASHHLPNRIVIVECYSSAVNYIHDLRARGCEPILLERLRRKQSELRSAP